MINSGSSSIKFSIFDAGEGSGTKFSYPRVLFAGEISGIGAAKLGFTFRDAEGRELNQAAPQTGDASDRIQ